jgi:hypothetical protein
MSCRLKNPRVSRSTPRTARIHLTVLDRLSSRLPLLAAAALIAAAVADPLVEGIANTGLVGPGYADNDHLSVLPTLVVGGLLTLLVIYTRSLALVRYKSAGRDWIVKTARQISTRAPLADLPLVLVLQFAVLFIMESSEQLALSGRISGGTAWLGGPIWFSVSVHAAIGCACIVGLSRALRSIVTRCAVLVSIAIEFFQDAFTRSNAAPFARRLDDPMSPRVQSIFVHQLGERAPPLLLPPI